MVDVSMACRPLPSSLPDRLVQVCSILLDLCAVKGRMGLAEEIASLMETHRIPKGDDCGVSFSQSFSQSNERSLSKEMNRGTDALGLGSRSQKGLPLVPAPGLS